jgi:hypothetical protein
MSYSLPSISIFKKIFFFTPLSNIASLNDKKLLEPEPINLATSLLLLKNLLKLNLRYKYLKYLFTDNFFNLFIACFFSFSQNLYLPSHQMLKNQHWLIIDKFIFKLPVS